MRHHFSRRGFTLIEVIVAMVIMSLTAGVATVGLQRLMSAEDDQASWPSELRNAQRHAVESGTPVLIRPDSAPGSPVLFLPDGRAIGNGVDALTGRGLVR